MTEVNHNYWPQRLWDDSYDGHIFRPADETDTVRAWLESRLQGKTGSCFELGCFPGHYMAVLGDMGFELNGVDLTPQVEQELTLWLRSRGHRMGQIKRADVFVETVSQQYDVVCSFGFLEHFENWREVLALHVQRVLPGGLLAVTTPNFRGWAQHFLHDKLDAENLARHNIDAMCPHLWAEEVTRLGMTVHEYGGLGRFNFWAEQQPRTRTQRAALKLLMKSRGGIQKLTPCDSLTFAPHLRLLAQRPLEG